MSNSTRCLQCGAEVAGTVATVCPHCASRTKTLPVEPATLAPNHIAGPEAPEEATLPSLAAGTVLGPVRLVNEIGRGAMGVVYRGHHTILNREVAVKVLSSLEGTAEDVNHVRFLQEARAAAAVQHPHLVQVHDAAISGNVPYIVMQYVGGPTLRRLLLDAGALPIRMAIQVLEDIAPAIDELHRRGVVHRDIKPSNVLLDQDGVAYVGDFGLALRRMSAGGAGASELEVSGTPAYMAPEMFEGQASTRSDLYALGISIYELLTGAAPFQGSVLELREKHRQAGLPAEPLRAHGVTEALADVIERAAHKRAIFRYKTASDFLRAFREAAGTSAATGNVRIELATLLTQGQKPRNDASDRHQDAPAGATYYDVLARMAATKRELHTKPNPTDKPPQ